MIFKSDKDHQCPVCWKTFNKRSNLKTHIFNHSNIKPKQLEEIVENFTRGGGLVCGSGEESMEEIDVCSLDENFVETDIAVEKRFTSSFSIEQLLK